MSGAGIWFRHGLDQDWVDSANGFWSVLLLAVCSAGAFLVRYATEPITCWTPAQFTRDHSDFVKQTCFAREMYYIRIPGMDIPSITERQGRVFSYHLWIPMFLFFQALCFKIPNIIWKLGQHSLTLNLDSTVNTLTQALATSPETRRSVFQDAARVLGKLLEGNKFLLGILYLFVKLLFCLNLLGQLVFLTIYSRNTLVIRTGGYIGLNVTDLAQPIFSKSIVCDFSIPTFTNIQHFSVSCELRITEMYEKLFVFLWFWILLLAVVTFFNLLLWAGFLFIPFFRDRKIAAYVKAIPGSPHDSSVITRFIGGFLGIDGVLLLSMISRNSSEMVAADLSQQLYQIFLGHTCQPTPSTSGGETTGALAPPVVGAIPMDNITYRGGYRDK